MDCVVCAVLPAAGYGERLGGSKPKQYTTILGKPLIYYAMESFEKIAWISKVAVVSSPEYVEYLRGIVEDYNFMKCEVVVGGSTRHRSIAAGIKAIAFLDPLPEVVVIHDAVRPLVPIETLTEVVQAARKYGAAGAVRKLVSTIVSTDDDYFLKESLDRAGYRASEMPQAFQYDVVKSAYDKCSEYDMDYGTECLQIALKYASVKAKLVEGPPDLWKVTHRKDIHAIDGLLREISNQILIISDNVQSNVVDQLQKKLGESYSKVTVYGVNMREPGDYSEYNNTIYVHCDKDIKELVRKNTSRDAEKQISSTKEWDVYGSVVYIMMYTKDPVPTLDCYPEMHTAVGTLTEQGKRNSKCVHVIWNVVDLSRDANEKIANLAGILIKERNSALHGQLFVI